MAEMPPSSVTGPVDSAQARSAILPHRGVAVLVLGIVSLVVCFICGIIALVMAVKDLRKMKAGIMDPAGRGMTQAGLVCGIIGIVLNGLISIVLLVAFALPSVFFLTSARTKSRPAIAYISLEPGDRTSITASSLSKAERDLQVLRALGVDRLVLTGNIQKLPGLEAIDQYPVGATYMMFFADRRTQLQLKELFFQQAVQSATVTNAASVEDIKKNVDLLADMDPSQATFCYFLLGQEAKHREFRITPDQVDAVISALPSEITIQKIVQHFHITEDEIKNVISDYLGILVWADRVTKIPPSPSEVNKVVQQMFGIANITGTYVTFEAQSFLDQVAEPTEEILLSHFENYKKYLPGEVTDENPHGFSYHLPDRICLEYLKLDLGEALKVVTEEFEKLSPLNREERITEFYRENRELFRTQDESVSEEEGISRVLPFDAVADKAKSLLLKHQARQRAQMLLEEAKHLSSRQNFDLRDLPLEERAALASDYQAIALQLNAEIPGVEYVKTEFLSHDEVWESELGRAYLGSRNVSPLAKILFSCAPFQRNSVTALEDVHLELYEDIGPAFSPAEDDSGSYYLLRIVAVDKARPPLSLADDGRRGPPEKMVSKINDNKLYERVREDWKMLQAFQLAEQKAQMFALQAEDDWDVALDQARASLDDKLKETAELSAVLPEQNLQHVRKKVEQWQYFLRNRPRNSPNLGPYVSIQIAQANALLQKAVDLRSWKSEMNQENLALLVWPENFRCLVFRNLMIPTMSDQEYAQRKPLVEKVLLNQNQALASLTHFNPADIEKRTGFTFTEDAD